MLLRKLLIGIALVAVISAAVASTAIGRSGEDSVTTSVLMPGVTYTREIDFTSRGPIVLDVVTAPKPDGHTYSLAPALSNDTLRGREALAHLGSRIARGATTVAIDGDYFDRITGAPNGILMQNGILESEPNDERSSLGIAADGTLTARRVSFAGIWQGKGQRRALGLNTPAGNGKFTLYTPAYGAATPTESGVAEAVIGKFPPAQLNEPLEGTVTAVTTAGRTTIPRGGAVLVARGRPSAPQLEAEAAVGQKIVALVSLSPDWSGLPGAIGGGPLLVKNGKPIFRSGESFVAGQLNSRRARGAIGQLADGRIVLVGVEGTTPANSIGMSNYELAVELSRLGATTAFGLGAGSAAGIAFDGQLLTRPSSGTPRVSDALVLSYSGIYAAPPSTAVLSPNGDGVGDSETFSYRVARSSHVVATLAGPSGAKVTLANGAAVSSGLHAIGWNGTEKGSPAPEGEWTFTVTGTDDHNVTTSAQRTFSLDDTLSSLALTSGRHGLPTATFKLTRAATVLVQIQRPNGVPVATLRSGPEPAGPEQVTWGGRIRKHRAPGGHYQVVVQATSTVGTSSLAAPFSLPAHKRK